MPLSVTMIIIQVSLKSSDFPILSHIYGEIKETVVSFQLLYELLFYVEIWVLQKTQGRRQWIKSIHVEPNSNKIKQQNFIWKTCP